MNNDKLLTTKEAANLMGVSTQTLMRYYHKNGKPQPIKLSDNYFKWKKSDIEDYINSKK